MPQLNHEMSVTRSTRLRDRSVKLQDGVVTALLLAALWGCDKSGSEAIGVAETSNDAGPVAQGSMSDLPPVGTVAEPDVEPSASPGFGGFDAPTITIDDESTDDTSEPEADSTLQRCTDAVGMGSEPLVDDFEDDDLDVIETDGRAANWYSYNSSDDSGQMFVIKRMNGLPSEGIRALFTSGSGYEWAGIGMGLRWAAPDVDGIWRDCVYDASVYDGVRFWARGNGEEVRLTISVPGVIPLDEGGTCDPDEAPCWANHGIDLTIGDDWVEYYVAFSDLEQPEWGNDLGPLDTQTLRTLQFEFPQNADFALWIDDIGFYSGEPMPRAPVPFVDEPSPVMPDDAPDAQADPPDDVGGKLDGGAMDAGAASEPQPGDGGR